MKHRSQNPDRWAHWEELLWLLSGRDADQKLGEIKAVCTNLGADAEIRLSPIPRRKRARSAGRSKRSTQHVEQGSTQHVKQG